MFIYLFPILICFIRQFLPQCGEIAGSHDPRTENLGKPTSTRKFIYLVCIICKYIWWTLYTVFSKKIHPCGSNIHFFPALLVWTSAALSCPAVFLDAKNVAGARHLYLSRQPRLSKWIWNHLVCKQMVMYRNFFWVIFHLESSMKRVL